MVFAPVGVLAVWTMVVLFLTGLRRLGAVRARRIPPGAFRYGESPEVPDDVRVWNRHLMNLLEMPLLFYVASVSFYVTRQVTAGVVALAWAYVALRLLHSFIHLTSNRVVARLLVFAAGNFVLLAQWIWFLARLL
jgi:hypothetical protein